MLFIRDYLRNNDTLNEYSVPVTITLPDGNYYIREYTVNAVNEEEAQRRAEICARMDRKNQPTEDKYYGLIYRKRKKWWNLIRLRTFRRGAENIFQNADYSTGDLFKGGIETFKNSANTDSSVNTKHHWSIEDLTKYRRNCIVTIICYFAGFLAGLLYIVRGVREQEYIYVKFLNPTLLAGTVLVIISLIYLYRSWKHLSRILEEIVKMDEKK